MPVLGSLTFLCWVECFGVGGRGGAGSWVFGEATPVVFEWEGRFYVMFCPDVG